jgi:hypothetical protein
MLKMLLFTGLVLTGLCATAGNVQAHYPYYGAYGAYRAPYYGYRYYAGPTAGVAYRYAGYGPYYNYAYRYYNYAPVVYPAYPYYGYAAPVYYGPRFGVSYWAPRAGVYVGF